MRSLRVALALLLTLTACRDAAYLAASKQDTIVGWRQFLEQHPKDDNAPGARARLAELVFADAQRVHTVVAYKRFLEEFSDADQAPAARALLETLRFNAATAKATAAALRQFLREHPDGKHAAEAQAAVDRLEVRELSASTDAAELARFVAAHPDDPRSAEASARLDDATFAAATTPALLYAYLREAPSGAHRDEAKARLLSLQLDGLLVSNLVEEARAVAKRSALTPALKDFEARAARAEAIRALAASKDARVRQALVGHYLRAPADVVRSLQATDPMDRWQAAEELGAQVSVSSIDPLLEAVRTARAPLVRQRAFESLGRVLRALPRAVADYEVATRLEALRAQASDAQLVLSMAALLDLSGQLDRAATEYGRAWDPASPDPVVLRRWAEIRRERRQFFSAAVAARQLSTWAAGVAGLHGSVGAANALSASRELCGAADAARFAVGVIAEARAQRTEFPEDLEQFALRAQDALKLAEARLRDAELALLSTDPRARRCGDEAVRERLADGEQRRLAALEALRKQPTKGLELVLEALRERDPSPAVRAAAR